MLAARFYGGGMASFVARAPLSVLLTLLAVGCGNKSGTTLPKLDAWQGKAEIALETAGAKSTLSVAKRGDTYRFDAPDNPDLFGTYGGEGPRHYLFDGNAKTLILVVDASKQALEYDVTVLDGLANKDLQDSGIELKDTGRKHTVAGFGCELWFGSSASTTVEACVVQQTATAFRLGEGFLPTEAGWARTLLDGEHVALSVHVKEGDTTRFKAEVTRFEQKIPEGEFDVPKDYDRQNFLQALKRVQQKQQQAH